MDSAQKAHVGHRYFGVFYGFLERGAQDKRLFLEDEEPFARRPERRKARL